MNMLTSQASTGSGDLAATAMTRGGPKEFAIALVALAATLAVRWLLDPLLGDRQPLALVFGAVAVAVWVGGWRPALMVVVAGYLAGDWLFIEPREAFGLRSFADIVAVVVYLVSCGIVIAFGEAMHRARAGLLAGARSLQAQGRELQRLNDELRQADARKDDFVATLAHELRNHIAPMNNAVHIVRSRAGADPHLARGAAIAERQVAQMARLLEDLMDASRIRTGKVEIRRESIDLRDVLAEAVETSRPNIEAAGHELSVRVPDDPMHLRADPARLVQVFANLLNNATKYTDRGGHIDLAAVSRDREVEVCIADDGIGFSSELGARLFQPYQQSDGLGARAQGGLGIGLALVRAIVELHGGQVAAHSDGPGRGSRFVVVLPR